MSVFICVNYIYIYIYILSWLTIVKDNQKAPFSIATTLRFRIGPNSFL